MLFLPRLVVKQFWDGGYSSVEIHEKQTNPGSFETDNPEDTQHPHMKKLRKR